MISDRLQFGDYLLGKKTPDIFGASGNIFLRA